MSWELPNLDPLWVSIFVTTILVFITGFYAWETRKMRLESVKPIFSLRTGLYVTSRDALKLYLVNNGGVAKNIDIDISGSHQAEILLNIPSLVKGEVLDLEDINPKEVKSNKEIIIVDLSFKDSYNRNLDDTLILDYSSEEDELRKVGYRYIPKDDILKDIKTLLYNRLPR